MTGQETRHGDSFGSPASVEFLPMHFVRDSARLAAALLVSVGATVYVTYISWYWTAYPLAMFDGILSPADVANLYPSNWLTWGHASIAAVFLITNLVNRRYGEQTALGHVLACAFILALIALAKDFSVIKIPNAPHFAPGIREVAAFITAMTLGQAASVLVFERTRGVEWWNAPAYAALTAALIAMPLYYVLAFAGSSWIWINHMAIDIALKSLMAFALLIPYLLLRPFVRPKEGLGGF